jgi:hypothetical protein
MGEGMEIENFKRWHWIVIGAVLGAILVYTRLYNITDGTRVVPGDGANFRRTVSPLQFVGAMQRPRTEKGFEWLRGVTIYPPVEVELDKGRKLNKSYVSGEELEIQPSGKGIYKPFQFYADVPFSLNPKAAAPKAGYTIRDYIDELAKKNPKANTSYRFAWWAQPAAIVALWGGGTLLAVGGIWPLVLGVMIGAGLGRKKEAKAEDEYDLERFGKGKEPQKQVVVKSGPSEADQQKLKDLQETLEKNLAEAGMIRADGSPVTPDVQPGSAAPAVRKLDGGPLQAMPAAASEADEAAREYKGEFYPVARPGKAKDDEPQHEEANH